MHFRFGQDLLRDELSFMNLCCVVRMLDILFCFMFLIESIDFLSQFNNMKGYYFQNQISAPKIHTFRILWNSKLIFYLYLIVDEKIKMIKSISHDSNFLL